jgi:thiol-disulfide isomerase/thioredoxin
VAGSPGTTVFKSGTGPVAPSVSGPVVGGGKLALASYRGHVVVLNFWGSWCTPCRAEAPGLSALATAFKSSGVRFLGIDIRDSPVSAEAFMSDFRISYPSLNDPSDNLALDFRDTVPPAGIPTTLVISRSGRIAARVIGSVTYDGLKSLIQRAVAEPG